MREEASIKHVAMENRLYPLRELLGDLLLEAKRPKEAYAEYRGVVEAVSRIGSAVSTARREQRKPPEIPPTPASTIAASSTWPRKPTRPVQKCNAREATFRSASISLG